MSGVFVFEICEIHGVNFLFLVHSHKK